MIGIYKITSPNGRVYIGSSVDIKRRFKEYRSLNKSKGQLRLYRSFKKYGIQNHLFEIIQECTSPELYNLENHFGNKYKVLSKKGLNLSLPKSGEQYGGHSQKTKDKIRQSNFGKTFTPEHRINIALAKIRTTSGKNNSFYGKFHTDEFKKTRSIQRSGAGNPNAKLILHTEWGIYYQTIDEASHLYNVSKQHLQRMLNGIRKNKTKLIYV